MATIVGGIGTTHVPAIGNAIAKGLQHDPYWKPFFDGFAGAHEWLAAGAAGRGGRASTTTTASTSSSTRCRPSRSAPRPSTSTPTKAGACRSRSPIRAMPRFSWHLIESLVADEFDVTICQEMLVDHAFTIPHGAAVAGAECAAGAHGSDLDQHRAASAAVAGALLQARPGRSAARSSRYAADVKVLVLGTGGLSHQLDGERAGFINKEFDLMCLRQAGERSRRRWPAIRPPADWSSRPARRASSC